MGNIGSHMDLTYGWWRHQGKRTTSIRFRWISRNLPTPSIRKRLEGIALRMRVPLACPSATLQEMKTVVLDKRVCKLLIQKPPRQNPRRGNSPPSGRISLGFDVLVARVEDSGRRSRTATGSLNPAATLEGSKLRAWPSG